MREFLLADIGINNFTFMMFITLSVLLGVAMGYKWKKDIDIQKDLDKKCPYCGQYTYQLRTMKQVDDRLAKIKRDKHLDAMLKKADKAMRDADKFMKKNGFKTSGVD